MMNEQRKSRRQSCPRIGIYNGVGASHSWIWFIDLFERFEFFDVEFLKGADLQSDCLHDLDILVVSGGDTFAMAKAIGQQGAIRLLDFVEQGGLYIGSCAGAYLPMNSSKQYLNDFNFASVRVANLRKILPAALKDSKKFCTAYGCDYIFHPVREAVHLKIHDRFFHTGRYFEAPLYGGPAMIPSDTCSVLASYENFTRKTEFLVDPEIAWDTLIGKAAAVKAPKGTGSFYLFGPHFEHPQFPEANTFIAETICSNFKKTIAPGKRNEFDLIRLTGSKKKMLVTALRRELSNCRITASGLELVPIHWMIGAKYYEPGKIRVFFEAMWRRIPMLKRADDIVMLPDANLKIIEIATTTTQMLRQIKQKMDQNADSSNLATCLFEKLQDFSTAFYEMFFKTLAHERTEIKKAV